MSVNPVLLVPQLKIHCDRAQNKRWKITLIGGGGAVGAYFAKQLVEAGHEVSIITKENSASLENIEKTGLTLVFQDKEFNLSKKSFNYVGGFKNFPRKIQDLVILSLKQPDMSSKVADRILCITDENSMIGVITNGLPFYFLQGIPVKAQHLESIDPAGKIISRLMSRKMIGIQPVIAARLLAPAKIQVIRPLTSITVVVGPSDNTMTENIKALGIMLNKAGINTTLTETGLRKNILEKLQFALSINTLSAIMEKNLGEIFEDEKAQALIRYSIQLTNAISLTLGLGSLRSYEQFKSIKITKKHFSSLYHDIKAGKEGETRAIVDASIEMVELLKTTLLHVADFPNLEPLKILKHLINFVSKGYKTPPEALLSLFDSCNRALLPPHRRLLAKL